MRRPSTSTRADPLIRHREERSDAAIQRSLLDCFAALAMTVLLFLGAPASAQTFPVSNGSPVVDQAGILNNAEELKLATRSRRLEQRTSDQLVIVTIRTLGGQDITEYGRDLGNAWRIGQKGLDNGVLLIVAPNENKVRVAVGYGLEGLLTDQKAAVIVADMLPYFRAKQYGVGIQRGEREIIQVLLSDIHRPRRKLA